MTEIAIPNYRQSTRTPALNAGLENVSPPVSTNQVLNKRLVIQKEQQPPTFCLKISSYHTSASPTFPGSPRFQTVLSHQISIAASVENPSLGYPGTREHLIIVDGRDKNLSTFSIPSAGYSVSFFIAIEQFPSLEIEAAAALSRPSPSSSATHQHQKVQLPVGHISWTFKKIRHFPGNKARIFGRFRRVEFNWNHVTNRSYYCIDLLRL